MAPEGTKLFVRLESLWPTSQMERIHLIRQFGRQPHSTVRWLCAPATLHTQGGFRQQGRGKMSRSQRETGKWRCTGIQVSASSSGSPPRAGSALFLSGRGNRFCGNRPQLPCPLAGTSALFSTIFRHHHRRNLSLSRLRELFSRLRITSQSSRARLDMWARRPGARISSVSATGVKNFAYT